MRTKKLLIPVLVLAAMLAMAFTSLAEGWQQSGTGWVYYDANNNLVSNEWRRGADDKWRYLDGSGNMAVNSWIDDTYYVNADGIMLSDTWQKLVDDGEEFWYYFQASGKAVQDKWKNINNLWYYFDDQGRMRTGWILDDMYFCAQDGHMLTGWQKLVDPERMEDDSTLTPGTTFDDDDVHWYYFLASGKKFVPEETENGYGDKRIDGVKYCFDEKGAMQTGWVSVGEGTDILSYKYFNEDGTMRTGWYSLNPPDDLQSSYENDVEWFYFNNTGFPAAADRPYLLVSDIRKINGKSFAFRQNGTPAYGLQKLYTNDNLDDYEIYYFGTLRQSSVQKGKMNVEEGDGTVSAFYFQDTGRGYSGQKDGYLYYKGKLQMAEPGTKYQIIAYPNGSGKFMNYLVSTTGKIEKNKKTKDTDGVVYKTNSQGVVISIDDTEVEGVGPRLNDAVEVVAPVVDER